MIRRADDPVWERAFRRTMTTRKRCQECDAWFVYRASPTGGYPPRYCSGTCRRAARAASRYEAKVRAAL